MEIFIAITIGLGLLFAGILFMVMSFSWLRKDEVSNRVETFVVKDDRTSTNIETSLRARRRELRDPFFQRTIAPFLRQISQLFSALLPARWMVSLDRKLQMLGNPLGFRSREFLGLQIALFIGGIVAAYFINGIDNPYALLLATLVVIFVLITPTILLNRSVRNRQDQIRRELPNVIDMLSICTSAGLGFDQSLQRVSEEWRTQLSWEFGRVVSEMEMGLSRKDALRNLAERLDVSELSSFVSIIIQSDQLGMSIADTLHTLAQQMRVEYRFRIQEEARKIPVKILIPLVFFIFPAMLAVLLGPSVPSLLGLIGSVQ
jgi:tight adherence protein C